MDKKKRNLTKWLKVLLGFNEEWKRQFDTDTDFKVEKLGDKWATKGLYQSGRAKREINNFKAQRQREKQDEERKRLIEGLSAIPPWLTLVLSLIAIVISIIALTRIALTRYPTP